MADYKIVEVQSKKDLKRFIKFPDTLYKDCPQYVPALHSDQVFSLTKTSTLSYCSRKMWLVMDGSRVVGRICAMINPRYNELYKTKRVRFGWFDTINDIEVARLLIGTAEAWAKENGMTEIHGPLYYNTLGKQGMLVEGFENTPPFNCLYNYSYYNDLISRLGFKKECDWIQYRLRADQPVPEKMVAIADRLLGRYNIKEKQVEALKHNHALVRKFFKIYNEGFVGAVHNFIPFTDEEVEEEAKNTIGMLDNRLCCFLFDEEQEVAAFGVSFPCISKALQKARGSMFPFGWFHLLKALKKFDTVDLVLTGAAPKWQNTGVSSIFHVIMARNFRKNGVKWAITNPQIEDNSASFVWDKYGDCEPFMRRRCYIKEIK